MYIHRVLSILLVFFFIGSSYAQISIDQHKAMQSACKDKLLEEFKSDIVQEIIDESIDNHLNDFGFVQINNLISGQLIYQSPEIKNYNIEFKTSQKRKTQKIQDRLQQRLLLVCPRT